MDSSQNDQLDQSSVSVDTSANTTSDNAQSLEEQIPTVSIIVPVYNDDDYLEPCLQSILDQDYQDFELICVNDGSTDDSRAILERFAAKDSRIIIIDQENQGPGVARNTGMDHARGAYLLFVDSDDYVLPDILTDTVKAIEENDAEIVIFDFVLLDMRDGASSYPAWTLIADRYPKDVFSWRANPDHLFFTFQNYPWNKLFRASFVREHQLRFQDIYLSEDLLFTGLAMLDAERMIILHHRYVGHREGTENNVMAHKDSHSTDFIEAFKLFRQKLIERDIYDEIGDGFRYWAASAVSYNLLTYNNVETFNEVFSILRDGGLDSMGIGHLEKGAIKNEFDAYVVQCIEANDKISLLYHAQFCYEKDRSLAQYRLEIQYTLAYLRNVEMQQKDQQLETLRLTEQNNQKLTEENELLIDEVARLQEANEDLQAQVDYYVQRRLIINPRRQNLAKR